MNKRKDLSRGAFTLVEVLVSVFIASFIIAAIFAVLNVGDMSWRIDSGLLDLQQQGRLAISRMASELRQSKASYITISNNGGRIDFKIPLNISVSPVIYSSNIAYYKNESNQIIREYPLGTTSILANDINTLNFCCWYSDNTCDTGCSSSVMLKVQLEASKTEKSRVLLFSLKEEVRLRNEL